MSWVAAAIGGGAALGYYGSQKAAKTQSDAANNATQAQLQMYNQTRGDLAPWMQSGNVAMNELNMLLGLQGRPTAPDRDPFTQRWAHPGSGDGVLDNTFDQAGFDAATNKYNKDLTAYNTNKADPQFGSLLKPFGMEDFQASPNYNFNLEQGKQAIDKASAARGNFYAPSTLQDIAKFSQGVASNEFQQAYSNYNNNIGNVYNRLRDVSGSGQNAAAQTGGFGTSVGAQVGNNMIGAGNANAAGTMGGVNAITGGMQNYLNYNMYQQLMRNQQPSVSPGMSTYIGNDPSLNL